MGKLNRRKLCECHICGLYVKSGKRFIHGHSNRKNPISIPNHHPCKCPCGELVASNRKFVHGHNGYQNKGKILGPMSEENKQKRRKPYGPISEEKRKNMRVPKSEEGRKNMKEAQNRPDIKERSSQSAKKNWQDPVYRENQLLAIVKGQNKLETKEKKSRSYKKLWQDPVWKTKQLLLIGKGSIIKPNNPEHLIDLITHEYWQGWQYTGDLSVIINGKNPDFINEESKQIIELYGDYWHNGEDPTDRAEIFSSVGYETRVIWENELKNLDNVILKLRRFCGGIK